MNMMKDEKINMLTERINDLVQQVRLFSLSFNLFLAHLAKGIVSICHHLASVVCHCPDPLTNMAATGNSCFEGPGGSVS